MNRRVTWGRGGVWAVGLAWAGLLLSLGGCEAYALRGKVVSGSASAVSVVSADAPALDAAPLGGASVVVMLEPDTLERRRLPMVQTDERGRFTVPIDEVGAGLLQYEARIVAWRKDHAKADATIRLPGSGKRLLIVLGPGTTRGAGVEPDLIEDTLRFRDAFER